MKFSLFSRVVFVIAAIALTTPAFAAGAAHKGYVSFADPVQINGTQVPAGEYKVTWDGDGPSVNLHILRGNKELAATPATVKPLDSKAPEDSAETRRAGSGAPELTAIRFSGKTYELEIGSTASRADVKGSDTVK